MKLLAFILVWVACMAIGWGAPFYLHYLGQRWWTEIPPIVYAVAPFALFFFALKAFRHI